MYLLADVWQVQSGIPYRAQLIYFEWSNNYVDQYEDSPL